MNDGMLYRQAMLRSFFSNAIGTCEHGWVEAAPPTSGGLARVVQGDVATAIPVARGAHDRHQQQQQQFERSQYSSTSANAHDAIAVGKKPHTRSSTDAPSPRSPAEELDDSFTTAATVTTNNSNQSGTMRQLVADRSRLRTVTSQCFVRAWPLFDTSLLVASFHSGSA